VESSVTQHDRHSTRLLTDLINNRDKIFQDLKRQSKKARPESLDESQRRVRYEARARAVSAAARSPRLPPVDQVNGDNKTPTHARRVSGITGITSGILANRPPSLQLEPGDNMMLDGGLPAGGQDEPVSVEKVAPVEVTVTDESTTLNEGTPTKKLSLGRSHRIGVARPVGLQRHLKRESQIDATATADVDRPVGYSLTDGPSRE
jgi:hypothetical protein